MDKRTLLPTLCALLLAGCGGGGTDIGGNTPASVSVSGTAATGQAVAARTVNADCSDGKHYTSINPSSNNGHFAFRLEAGALPCALEIDTGKGYSLHGFATQAGTANVTPLTDLALALNNTTHDWYAGLGSPDAATLEAISGQLDQLATYLKGKLVAANFGAASELAPLDIFNGAFEVGDNADQLLDAIGQAVVNSAHTDYPALRQVLLDNTSESLPQAPADYAYDDPDVEPGLSIDPGFDPTGTPGGLGDVTIGGIHLPPGTTITVTGS